MIKDLEKQIILDSGWALNAVARAQPPDRVALKRQVFISQELWKLKSG